MTLQSYGKPGKGLTEARAARRRTARRRRCSRTRRRKAAQGKFADDGACAGEAGGLGDHEHDVGDLGAQAIDAPGLLLEAKNYYLQQWINDIDAGLQNWGKFGLALTNALFNPQTYRNPELLQRVLGNKTNPLRVDARTARRCSIRSGTR